MASDQLNMVDDLNDEEEENYQYEEVKNEGPQTEPEEKAINLIVYDQVKGKRINLL